MNEIFLLSYDIPVVKFRGFLLLIFMFLHTHKLWLLF